MDPLREPNKERLIAALNRRKLDRVPNFEDGMDPGIVGHVFGRERGPAMIGLPPDEAVEFARRTHQDAVTIFCGPMPWPGTLFTWDDVEKWQIPDPAILRDHLKRYLAALKGTRIGLNAIFWGPFFTAFMAVGPVPIQDFFIRLYEEPAFTERLMDRILEAQLRTLEAVMDLPIDVIEIGDDTCDNNGYLCAEEIMNRIWVPRIEKLVRLAQQKGVPIQWHCCGKLDQLMPRLVEWGIHLVSPVQPKCNDIYALKKQWGDRIAFRGNMNIEGVLAFGTPDDVRADTREHIERLSVDGGYVVGSSHSIVDAIPPENYFAMIETACEHGVY